MPRGTNPKSLANLKNGVKTRFSGERAVKAAKKSVQARAEKRQQSKTIQEIAKIINGARVNTDKARERLASLGVADEDMTNAALIASAVLAAAMKGDMKAVEKWESYVNDKDGEDGGVKIIIDV